VTLWNRTSDRDFRQATVWLMFFFALASVLIGAATTASYLGYINESVLRVESTDSWLVYIHGLKDIVNIGFWVVSAILAVIAFISAKPIQRQWIMVITASLLLLCLYSYFRSDSIWVPLAGIRFISPVAAFFIVFSDRSSTRILTIRHWLIWSAILIFIGNVSFGAYQLFYGIPYWGTTPFGVSPSGMNISPSAFLTSVVASLLVFENTALPNKLMWLIRILTLITVIVSISFSGVLILSGYYLVRFRRELLVLRDWRPVVLSIVLLVLSVVALNSVLNTAYYVDSSIGIRLDIMRKVIAEISVQEWLFGRGLGANTNALHTFETAGLGGGASILYAIYDNGHLVLLVQFGLIPLGVFAALTARFRRIFSQIDIPIGIAILLTMVSGNSFELFPANYLLFVLLAIKSNGILRDQATSKITTPTSTQATQ
jgi:hypothetical protein